MATESGGLVTGQSDLRSGRPDCAVHEFDVDGRYL